MDWLCGLRGMQGPVRRRSHLPLTSACEYAVHRRPDGSQPKDDNKNDDGRHAVAQLVAETALWQVQIAVVVVVRQTASEQLIIGERGSTGACPHRRCGCVGRRGENGDGDRWRGVWYWCRVWRRRADLNEERVRVGLRGDGEELIV